MDAKDCPRSPTLKFSLCWENLRRKRLRSGCARCGGWLETAIRERLGLLRVHLQRPRPLVVAKVRESLRWHAVGRNFESSSLRRCGLSWTR